MARFAKAETTGLSGLIVASVVMGILLNWVLPVYVAFGLLYVALLRRLSRNGRKSHAFARALNFGLLFALGALVVILTVQKTSRYL